MEVVGAGQGGPEQNGGVLVWSRQLGRDGGEEAGGSLRDEGSSLTLPPARDIPSPRRWQRAGASARHPHSSTPRGTGSGPSQGDFQPGHAPLQPGSCRGGPRGPMPRDSGPRAAGRASRPRAESPGKELIKSSQHFLAVNNFLRRGRWQPEARGCEGASDTLQVLPPSLLLAGLKNPPKMRRWGRDAPVGDGKRGKRCLSSVTSSSPSGRAEVRGALSPATGQMRLRAGWNWALVPALRSQEHPPSPRAGASRPGEPLGVPTTPPRPHPAVPHWVTAPGLGCGADGDSSPWSLAEQ